MRQFIGIIDICRYLSGILPSIVTEHILITFFSGTQYYNLYFILADFIQNTFNQVKAFLICQSGYYTDHHHIRIFFQTKLSLKCYFILCLFCQYICCIKLIWKMNIRLWIKDIIINTIYNTGKHIRTCLQQLIQLLSVKFCLNLFRVSLTDGSHTVCIDNTTLQQIHITVSFQLIRCEIAV